MIVTAESYGQCGKAGSRQFPPDRASKFAVRVVLFELGGTENGDSGTEIVKPLKSATEFMLNSLQPNSFLFPRAHLR